MSESNDVDGIQKTLCKKSIKQYYILFQKQIMA